MDPKKKIRTIITQDAEVDDRNSLRHFLLYANEVEVQGIIQTSSKFHWIGIPGAVKPEKGPGEYEFMGQTNGPYDKPYRWPGTDWMFEVIDDYEKDYRNLVKHADGYPTPDYLRSITKIGNIGYEGEMENPTDGSELIRKCILDDDKRPLYIQVWGGTNTIARALLDIENEYKETENWEKLHDAIEKKVIMTACGEQDSTYRDYIAESWPNMQFVKTLQMGSYAYPWKRMPDGESKDTLGADFMKKEILNGKSALASGYCTWLDGNHYPGEENTDQFGSNPNIADEWFGARFGLPKPVQYDFLSEGDSPTFFMLFDWGFRTLEDFSYGGISGRYYKVKDQVNSKNEPLNVWDVAVDDYVDRDGNTVSTESMWQYVAVIQRDFAARISWCSEETYEEAEHAPSLCIKEGVDLRARKGETITIHALAGSDTKDAFSTLNNKPFIEFNVYHDASASWSKEISISVKDEEALISIPKTACIGDQIHIIVKAETKGHYRLTHYQQVIITVH